MSHFLFAYKGNKRSEVKYLLPVIKNIKFNIVVEPFCGSAAYSFGIYKDYPNAKFILNDSDPFLCYFYNDIKSGNIHKTIETIRNLKFNSNEESNEYFKDCGAGVSEMANMGKLTHENYIKWLFIQKFNAFGQGRVKNIYSGIKNQNFKISKAHEEFFKFIQSPNVEIYNHNWDIVYDKFKHNEDVLMICDPPYMFSDNLTYMNKGFGVFETVGMEKCNNICISEYKANIIFVLEYIWIVKVLFQNLQFTEYKKMYAATQRQVIHSIILNRKIEAAANPLP